MKTAVPCYYHLDVEVGPERVGQVRRILAAHLRFWDLENLVEPVCRGAEVLLRAIDEHAADKNTSIEMWWNGQHLITAVGGNDPTLRPDHELRSCLEHIAALSDGWGCCATVSGGQVIWFTRRARAGERVPLVPTDPEPITAEALQLPREVRVPALTGSTEPVAGAAEEGQSLEPAEVLERAEVLEKVEALERVEALSAADVLESDLLDDAEVFEPGGVPETVEAFEAGDAVEALDRPCSPAADGESAAAR